MDELITKLNQKDEIEKAKDKLILLKIDSKYTRVVLCAEMLVMFPNCAKINDSKLLNELIQSAKTVYNNANKDNVIQLSKLIESWKQNHLNELIEEIKSCEDSITHSLNNPLNDNLVNDGYSHQLKMLEVAKDYFVKKKTK
tara:strand:+ start:8160 stop:8582 length:423 start_codon:yes stop_codon:yes gene_type:complete